MKNVLITGCSSGLGLALTNLYLEKGFNVYGIARNKPNISNESFHFITADLSKLETITTLKEQLQNINSFEYIYLNAGMLGDINTLANISVSHMQEVMNLNVYANKALLDILHTCKVSNIIAISSGASVNGSKGWSAYSLSKASLNMLINLYAKEMMQTQLLAVAPGVIETPMTDVIRYEVDDVAFPSAKVLKTGDIQSPKQAALRLYELNTRIKEFESGSFIDVRKV